MDCSRTGHDEATGRTKSNAENAIAPVRTACFISRNPLFPNGYYFTLAGYTGYANLIHIKPSLTLTLTSLLKITLAAAAQWRQNMADAVYTQPDVPLPNTAGRPGAYTGSYGQVRLDWTIDRATSFAVEAVHFAIGDALRNAGGHDSNYLGVEIKSGW
jgi:hypothetical protein